MSERAKRASSVYKEILSSGTISHSHLMDKSNPRPPAVQTRVASPARKTTVFGSDRQTATLSDLPNMKSGTSHSHTTPTLPQTTPNHLSGPDPPLLRPIWTPRGPHHGPHVDPTWTPHGPHQITFLTWKSATPPQLTPTPHLILSQTTPLHSHTPKNDCV